MLEEEPQWSLSGKRKPSVCNSGSGSFNLASLREQKPRPDPPTAAGLCGRNGADSWSFVSAEGSVEYAAVVIFEGR